MCFGRDLDCFRAIVLASDNNVSSLRTTQFHALKTNIPAVTRHTLASSVAGNESVVAGPSLAWCPEGSEVTLAALTDTDFTFD